MDVFVVQWCNVEEYDEMDIEIFSDLESAIYFLRKIIEINYPKDHTDDLTEEDFVSDDCEMNQERFFPYIYKISQKRIDK